MSVIAYRPTVGVTAVEIVTAEGDAQSATIKNKGAATIYLGGDNTVTTANGYELLTGEALSLDLIPGDGLWAISGTAGQTLHILALGQN